MRAIRFAAQLGFRIEDESFSAISRNSERIKIITEERIVDELNKILLTEKPSLGFILLNKTGLLKYILPELSALQGIDEIDGQTHKDNFYHTLEVVDNIQEIPRIFGYAGLPCCMISEKHRPKNSIRGLVGRFTVTS